VKDSTRQFLINGLRAHQKGEKMPPTTIPAEVCQFCAFIGTRQTLMKTAMNQLQLSARTYHRILKLACTIADLVRSEDIGLRRCSTGRG
jgi:predicted ATPase with chaperone activity